MNCLGSCLGVLGEHLNSTSLYQGEEGANLVDFRQGDIFDGSSYLRIRDLRLEVR